MHIGHSEIVRFADDRVNLKREDVKEYRDQVNRLRDRLEQHIAENPAFALRKMLLSGSLAKGTALKSINDIDVAVYVSESDAPATMSELIASVAGRLRTAFPNFKPEQVVQNSSNITILFSGTGLKVDIVPILYDQDPDWKGHIVYENGNKVLTSIPMHLDFIRRRKAKHEQHYAQIIRLLKYWVKYQRSKNPEFRFKSFMIELLVAHLVDRGLELEDYPEALANIFAYLATDAFRTDIAFSDHYDPTDCPECSDPIRIWDPVNHQNNVASRYTTAQREAIIDAALEAGDAVDSALRAPTKAEALRYWRKVFGPTFDA
jgi:tRNA nucleotidyltransferase (CCA-adding enzyme)